MSKQKGFFTRSVFSEGTYEDGLVNGIATFTDNDGARYRGNFY
jgi:hypothetical protein